MDDKTKIILFLIVVVVVGIPLLGQLAKNEDKSEAPAQTNTSGRSPAMTRKAGPAVRPPQPGPPQPAPVTPPRGPQPPANVPQLNAQTLANTAWTISTPQVGDVTVQLFANGTAQAQGPNLPMQIQGTWTVNGSNLVVTAMGQTLSAQIVANTLVANGVQVKRLR